MLKCHVFKIGTEDRSQIHMQIQALDPSNGSKQWIQAMDLDPYPPISAALEIQELGIQHQHIISYSFFSFISTYLIYYTELL